MAGFSIKEFTDLPKDAKSIIVGMVLIMPVWFIDIFFFHRTFFNSNQLYIVIVISYCLSIAWLMVNYILAISFRYIFNLDTKAQMFYSILNSLTNLLAISAVEYIRHRDDTFKVMVLIAFSDIGILIILALVSVFIKDRINKKKQVTTSSNPASSTPQTKP